ncbi:MAG: hypothetical protein IH801_08100, partial [Nitrospinae bacterium]|nr:hypothetical protein [Nitrospinota bacterium]
MEVHFRRLTIIGVGLIGGSLARVCRKKGLADELVGVGRGRKNLELAVELGVIDRWSHEVEEGVDGADGVRRLYGLEGKKVVTYVGQLHGAQFLEFFLYAARYLNSWRTDVRFLIAGWGGRLPELQELARKLGLEDVCTFAGA